MNRKETVADRWRDLIQRQHSSGVSVAAFCRRIRISQPSFYYWRCKLRDEVRFVEVKSRTPQSVAGETGAIELRLAGGRCVVVRPGFDRRTLVELIDALEAAGSDMMTREVTA